MTLAIYAGSFDPITNGHLDILKSATEIFDKVIIAVAYNSSKKGFLPIEKRVELIKASVKELKNVEVDSFIGLTVDYARKRGAKFLLRGLRSTADFQNEFDMAQVNSHLDTDIRTVFMHAKAEHIFISSSMIREILINNGDISEYVPQCVSEYFKKQY